MKNIYLVGFMGVGKTVVGKILARKLNREFVEMDEVVAQKEGREIVDIFAKDGEDHFRKLEKDLLDELSQRQDLIISCGGGLMCNDENLKVLCDSGLVVTLRAKASIIYARTKKYVHRPLLNTDNPLEKIEELLTKRNSYYNQAHLLIDTDNILPDTIADEIVKTVENG